MISLHLRTFNQSLLFEFFFEIAFFPVLEKSEERV